MNRHLPRMDWTLSLLVLALITTLAGLAPAYGAQTAQEKQKEREDEAKEAAREDAEDQALDLAQKIRTRQLEFHGLFLLQADKENSAVVGTFVGDERDKQPNRTYLVKVEKEDLAKTLARYDGKKIALQGKLRNKGKYLLVAAVIEPAPGPARTERRALGGL
ncbi:MAG: hypothetical protein NTW87_18820 [Planctomycetota bacterium]|nr:hypothetical protein [Planctomycetota bacterium]